MTSEGTVELLHDHALGLADDADLQADEAMVELVALAGRDRPNLCAARDLLERELASDRAGDPQAVRAFGLLTAAAERVGS